MVGYFNRTLSIYIVQNKTGLQNSQKIKEIEKLKLKLKFGCRFIAVLWTTIIVEQYF